MEAIFVKADVSKASDVENLNQYSGQDVQKIGPAPHNNAGIEGVNASTMDCTEENWDRVIDINLKVCGCA